MEQLDTFCTGSGDEDSQQLSFTFQQGGGDLWGGGSLRLGFPGTTPEAAFPSVLLSYAECPLCARVFVYNVPFSPHEKPVRGHCYFQLTAWEPKAEVVR